MDTDVLERPDIDLTESPEKGPECEMEHDHCTITAVAMGRPSCHPDWAPKLICRFIVQFIQNAISVDGLCGDCKRPVAVCWTVIPI